MRSPLGNLIRHGVRAIASSTAVLALLLGSLVLGSPRSGQPHGTEPVDGRTLSPVAAQLPAVVPTRTGSRPWPGHPGRRLVRYTVHRGDSATTIAVRFHAWTRELLAINHKRPTSTWYVGERVIVPVVVKRARAHHHQPATSPKSRKHPRPKAGHRTGTKTGRPALPRYSRVAVRNEVIRVARAYRVDPHLALAISWQESGWQQHVRSPAGAIGAMQVMPGTGRWISSMVGRPLRLRSLHDNVVAGVYLFRLLRQQVNERRALASYYQGLGSVQANGLYPSTKRYVKSVKVHRTMLDRGWRPLR